MLEAECNGDVICDVCRKGHLRRQGKRTIDEDGTPLFHYFQCENCELEFFSRWSSYQKESCEICGYDKHPSALERHHRKDGSLVVLCSNCHNIITRTGLSYSLIDSLHKGKAGIMIEAVIKSLNPPNPTLLSDLLIEEIEKDKAKRLDLNEEIMKHIEDTSFSDSEFRERDNHFSRNAK